MTDALKRTVVAALVALSLAGGAAAEGLKGGRDEGQRSQMAQLRQRIHNSLNLSQEQELQLKDLRLGLQAELEAIRARVADGDLMSSEGREAYGDAMRAHKMARDAVMTPEQRALLVRARRHVRDLELAREGVGEGGEHFAHLVEALELRAYQKERWHELLRDQRAHFQEMKAEAEGEIDPEIVSRLRAEHKARFRLLLDEQQLIELEEIRAGWELRRRQQIGADGSASVFGIDSDNPDAETATGEDDWGAVESETDEIYEPDNPSTSQ